MAHAKRRLIWVPIIHSQVDLGSMSEAVRRAYIAQLGRNRWNEHRKAVGEFWRALREKIDALELDYAAVYLYQDGLPEGEHAESIVRDLARQGSANHQILLDLMGRGARLVGTESPALLLEEYRLAQASCAPQAARGTPAQGELRRQQGRRILRLRDEHIAARIDVTLPPSQTGLLFLGMLHSLDGLLAADIERRQIDLQLSGD